MDINDAPPPALLMREFANSHMLRVYHPLSNELMNKIGHTCKLSVVYMATQQCIGHYDKNNKCMMLNGEASLSYYMRGATILLSNHENGAWVHHPIWQQQPLNGTRIVNTDTNETSVIRTEHGMLITSPE